MGKTELMRVLLYISFLLFSFTATACVCGGGAPSLIPVVAADSIPFVALGGESTSGAQSASNDSASAGELEVQTKTFILNNDSLRFESLDIGTNNNLGHSGQTCCTKHGFELQISNIAKTDAYWDSVRLVKFGFGGSTIAQWEVVTPDYQLNDPWYRTRRIDTAMDMLTAQGVKYKPVIVFPIGINDAYAGTSVDSFSARLVRVVNKLRTVAGANTPVVLFKYTGATISVYNTAVDSIAATMNRVWTITMPAGSVDGSHMGYAQQKIFVTQLLALIKTNYP